MSPIIVMDRSHNPLTNRPYVGSLMYRLPDDRPSFWTGKYPTAGSVQAFMCAECGRIALYGNKPQAET
jgi:hypothetical protein